MRRALLLPPLLLALAAAAPPVAIIGRPVAGCILGAVRLPDQAPGLQEIRESHSSFWGAPALIAALLDLGRRARGAGLPDLYVGDMSAPHGGPLAGHAGHEIGLEADVWLDLTPPHTLLPVAARDDLLPPSMVRGDGQDVDPAHWSAAQATLLRLAAGLPGIDRILVHPAIKRRLCAGRARRPGVAAADPAMVGARQPHAYPPALPGGPDAVRAGSAAAAGRRLRRHAGLVVRRTGASRPAGAARPAPGPARRLPRRAGRMRRENVPVAVAAAGVGTFLNLYTPQAILPQLAAAFAVTPAAMGLAVMVSLLAIAGVAPFAGAVSDVIGRKRLIVGAAVAVIAPTLLVATAQSFAALLVWRFVQGLLLPFIFTVTVAYIGDECSGADAIRAAGMYASGAVAGGFAGRFIAGTAAEFGGWRLGFAAVAAATAIAAAVIATSLPRERNFRPVRGGVRAMLRGWGEHARNPLLWGCCAVGAGMLFSVVATFTFVNLRLAAPPFRLSPAALGSVFAVYLVGMVTTPMATRAAVDIGRMRTALLAAAVGAAGELLTLPAFLPTIVLGLMAVCGGLFVAQALALSYIGVAVRRARSSAVGLYVAVYYIGGALGAVAPVPLWHAAGWAGCVALICAAIAAMAAASVLTFRER